MRFIFSARGSRAVSCALLASAAICCATAAQAAVTISDKPTSNMNCTGGVCSPTAKKANLNVTDLANMLAAGDAKVVSDSAPKDIEFKAPLSWTSTSRLTLDSYHSIIFQRPITVTGTGALTITTNDGGTGGDFWFEKKGHIEFWDLNSNLVTNGKSYTLVSKIAQLAKAVAKQPDGFYALAKKYNARSDGTYSQAPITNFQGTFEGLGNQISNFSLNLAGGIGTVGGLFDGNDGTLRDVSLVGVNVSAASNSNNEIMGALAGVNRGTIKGAAVSGKVVGLIGVPDKIGGVVGENYGTISDSHSSANLVNGAWSGGLVGFLLSQDSNATIVHCYATGDVSGSYSPGGLVGGGGNTTESIVNSFATGAIDNAGQPDHLGGSVGGLVGSGVGNITASYATGSVTGGKRGYAGGLIGAPSGTIDRSFSTGIVSATGECDGCGGLTGTGAMAITDSYSVGSVTPTVCDACGGLVGTNSGPISTSYSTGLVKPSSGFAVGGLIGSDQSNPNSLSNLYWNLDTSGVSDPSEGAGDVPNDPGITGLTDPQLKAALPTGFDPKVWGQNPSINNGYPYLLANPPPKT